MKITSIIIVILGLSLGRVGAFSPKQNVNHHFAELQKATVAAFTAVTISSSALLAPPPADALPPVFQGSSVVIAEKVIREGLYQDYEIDVQPQQYDDARSTFKAASETKSNKGKYTALLAILIVGSFVIPMAQYFWYVRDDDSSDKFFAGNVPEPKEPPKKKGWFN